MSLFPWRSTRPTQLDRIEIALSQLNQRSKHMAKTLDDILAAQADTLTKITAMKAVDDGIAAFVNQQKQNYTDLKAQLDEARAANDPAKLQAVGDRMDAINAALDAQAVAEAAVANTPAA